MLATIAIIITLLVPAVFTPAVSIVNTAVVALVLRPRLGCDGRDMAAALIAAAAVLVVFAVPGAATAVGIGQRPAHHAEPAPTPLSATTLERSNA
ncbi:hypothetical protein LFT51_29195 (plasmid) [Mycobacterium intracellulare subsp. chimaera]|uniref:hypothetical protein n=1 Tax=Mycobacterium intracellulare TaxID=1767 RepID=UPI00115BE5EB|nr:hypothetical protein [Mycobacterium intracellulare]QGK52135.1 hypothetical protein GJE02_29625 [Mycobacterium intracellulare subsp. chimaera]UCN07152.1 hypothetical protein LFT51_29195 [Mycobacterium intracellulare subsp. chimaera]